MEKQTNQTDELENVTLLFADIAGFTKYASIIDSNIVMSTLRQLFIAFDKKCLAHRVFKLYTIGDCYVVLGIQNIAKRDYLQEAENVVNMASSMIEEIKRIRKTPNFPFAELDMRIGIHTVNLLKHDKFVIVLFNFREISLEVSLDLTLLVMIYLEMMCLLQIGWNKRGLRGTFWSVNRLENCLKKEIKVSLLKKRKKLTFLN